jgi:hypothetical protein
MLLRRLSRWEEISCAINGVGIDIPDVTPSQVDTDTVQSITILSLLRQLDLITGGVLLL